MTIAAALGPAPPAPPQPIFPRDKLKEIAFWLRVFIEDWHGEVPLRIHGRDTGHDGAPGWHYEFENWIEREEFEGNREGVRKRQRDQRIRTTRAFRKLRKKAPREFDVLYSIVVHQMSITELSVAMTERAIRLDKPERYTPAAILILTVSAVDKMIGWW